MIWAWLICEMKIVWSGFEDVLGQACVLTCEWLKSKIFVRFQSEYEVWWEYELRLGLSTSHRPFGVCLAWFQDIFMAGLVFGLLSGKKMKFEGLKGGFGICWGFEHGIVLSMSNTSYMVCEAKREGCLVTGLCLVIYAQRCTLGSKEIQTTIQSPYQSIQTHI